MGDEIPVIGVGEEFRLLLKADHFFFRRYHSSSHCAGLETEERESISRSSFHNFLGSGVESVTTVLTPIQLME
tara:strand:+ start:159 stop:377 length:219 start_codon:yes stop_codon:yes gene_type:complete